MTTTSALDEAFARKALPSPPERKGLRVAAGLSARSVGRQLGVSGQAVLLWEAGDRAPRGGNLVAYVELLRQLAELEAFALDGSGPG